MKKSILIEFINNLKTLGWLHEPMASMDTDKLLNRYIDDLTILNLGGEK